MMKTLSKLLVVAGLFAFVACGPSAKDQAEKAKQDSIKQADSLMAVKAKEDSTAKVVAEKAKADSAVAAAKADSIEKASKTTKKGKK